jgi:hypothetical protein
MEPPCATEWRPLSRINETVAAQAVENEAGLQVQHVGEGFHHRYNALLNFAT